MNPVAEEMLGWTAAELHGVRVHDAIHYAYEDGSAYPADKCPQQAAYADGLECRVDGEVLWRRDGTCFPVEYIARPLVKDGAVTGAIISFRDVTERRAAEEALRESRERLDFVLRAAQVGVWEWEIGPDVIEWDETVAALYGLPGDARSGPWSVFDEQHPSRRSSRRPKPLPRGRSRPVCRMRRSSASCTPTAPSRTWRRGPGCAATRRARRSHSAASPGTITERRTG